MSNKKNKVLSDMIEKILFEQEELENLKALINSVKLGKVQPKQLRAAIIENRVKILDKLLRIFPYYHKQIAYQQEIDDFTENDFDIKLKKELEEKKDLLRYIGNWVQNTRKKIVDKSIV